MEIELKEAKIKHELLHELKRLEQQEQSFKIAIGKIQARRVLKKEIEGPEISQKREDILQENLKEVTKRIKQTKNLLKYMD
jgi:hypothetical protein